MRANNEMVALVFKGDVRILISNIHYWNIITIHVKIPRI